MGESWFPCTSVIGLQLALVTLVWNLCLESKLVQLEFEDEGLDRGEGRLAAEEDEEAEGWA